MIIPTKYLAFVVMFFVVGGVFASETSNAEELLDRFRSIDWSKREVGQNKDLSDDAWKVRIEVENELVALGESAVTTLIEACQDTDQHVRLLAAYVLGMLNHSPAASALTRIAESDPYAPARLMAIEALGRLGASEALDVVQAASEDNNGYIRTAAKWALPRVKNQKGVGNALRELALSTYDKNKIASAVVGKPAPDFALMNHAGEIVKLSDFRGKKQVVMIFLLADW